MASTLNRLSLVAAIATTLLSAAATLAVVSATVLPLATKVPLDVTAGQTRVWHVPIASRSSVGVVVEACSGEGHVDVTLNGQEVMHFDVGGHDHEEEEAAEEEEHDHRALTSHENHDDESWFRFVFDSQPGNLTITLDSEVGMSVELFASTGTVNTLPAWPFPLLTSGHVAAAAKDESSVTIEWMPAFHRDDAVAALRAGETTVEDGEIASDIVYDIIYHKEVEHEEGDTHGSTCGEFITDGDTVVIAGVMPSHADEGDDHDHRARVLVEEHSSGHVTFRVRGLDEGTEYHFDIHARNRSSQQIAAYTPLVTSTTKRDPAVVTVNVGLIVGLVIAGLVVGIVGGVWVTRRFCPTPKQAGFKDMDGSAASKGAISGGATDLVSVSAARSGSP